MKLLRKLFGKKPQAVKPTPMPVAIIKPEKPVISLDIVETTYDEPSLIALASSGETTQLRQAAANKVTTRAALEQIAKAVKSKDKTVYKLVKTKLDVFKEADNLQIKRDAQGLELCEKCERHLHHEADAVFKAKLTLIEQEFTAISSGLSDAIQQRFNAAKTACEQKIHAQADAIALEEERLQAERDSKRLAEETLADIEKIASGLLEQTYINEDTLKTAHLRVDELAHALRLSQRPGLNLQNIVSAFEKRKEQILNQLNHVSLYGTLTEQANALATFDEDALKKALTVFNQALAIYPAEMTNASATVTAARDIANEWQKNQRKAHQAKNDIIKHVAELVRKGSWAAEQGQVRRARAIQRELNELRPTLTLSIPSHVQTKWEEFEAQLVRLGDWHEFAVTPKKEQLIRDMQALADSDIEPDVRATRIHELQDEWREVSRGGQQQDDGLWQEFQAASAVAYAPCKEFFEAQSQAREANLTHRATLVETLRSYIQDYDWNNANWKDVEQTLKVARTEWQTYWPVPRKAGNDIAAEFETLMDTLHGKIKTVFDQNKHAKQALVNAAKDALSSEDLAKATETIKQLQQQWKTLGKTWHREDQSLWTQFRQHSDAVFARRKAEFDEQKQHQTSNLQKANHLIGEIKTLASQIAENLTQTGDNSELTAQLNRLNDEFSDLDLPKKEWSSLEKGRNEANELIEKAHNAARDLQFQKKRLEITALITELHTLEINAINSQVEIEKITALEDSLKNNGAIENSTKNILLQRISSINSLTKDQLKESVEALRLLCIRAEILRGEESPSEDKVMRMNYQVAQMQQGFGQPLTNFPELEKLWWSVPAVDANQYTLLAARFFK